MTRRGPVLALIAATVAVSFSAIFIHYAQDDPATVVWVRMAFATALLAPWAIRDVRRGAMRLPERDRGLLLTSGVMLAGHFLLWTVSLQFTSVAASVLLVSLHPVIVTPLGRRLLGERVGARTIASIVLAVGGTAITCAGDLSVSLTALMGDGFAVGGAVGLAGYLLIGRNLRPTLGVAGYSASVYGIVAVVSLASAALLGTAHVPRPTTLLWGGMLALVCTVGGHTVYNWALRHVRAATVSLAFLGEPPLTALLALLLLGAVPSVTTLIGGVFILAGLACALSEATPKPPAEALVAIE